MKKYFVLFHRQENQAKHAYSFVDESILRDMDKEIIKAKKEVEPKEIYTKEESKELVLELGGIWYGDQ